MRKLNFIKIFCIILIFVTAGFNSFRENVVDILTWTETTVEDFSDSFLDDVIITNIEDGEVRLPYPMMKTVEDYRDDSIHRFVAYDSSGNFVETWTEGGNVFVQKYSSDGNEIGGSLQVNDIDGIVGQEGISRVAMTNDGTFVVAWLNSGYRPDGNDYNMHGQIFRDDTVKVGSNFQINEFSNNGAHFPVVFANEADTSFWILYAVGNFYNGSKIYVHRRNLQGELLGETFRLNSEDLTKYERVYSVAVDKDGSFIALWTGENEPVSIYVDVYAKRFNSNGEAQGSVFKVNDDPGLNGQFQPDMSFDDSSNFLVVWGDERDNASEYGPYDLNIYSQFYSSDGIEIGSNFRINEPLYMDDREPDIDYINGEFQISWRSWNETSRLYEIYVNRWKFDPKYSGKLIS